jgi:hypothetical protein
MAFGRVAKATFATSGGYFKDTAKAKSVRDVLDRAAGDRRDSERKQ